MTSVFDHAVLGGLFADRDASDIWSEDRQLAHMLSFEAAYALALGDVGQVSPETAKTAAKLISGFKPDVRALREGTAKDGLPVPALVAQLRSASADFATAIHTGATSQDVIDTALSLTIRDTNDLLETRLHTLSQQLTDLTGQFGTRSLMGRTRMQAAIPMTVGDRMATWQMPIDENHNRLQDLRPRVELVQLGGAVGTRHGMGGAGAQIAENMAKQLKLTNPGKAWHSMRGGVVEYAGLLSLVTGALGKMGADICLMAQQGIDEIALVGGGGSSAMPHKQNPVLAELLVTLARFNATQVSGMHHALLHEQERSGSAWALEWMILPQMATATARSLSAGIALCRQISDIGALQD